MITHEEAVKRYSNMLYELRENDPAIAVIADAILCYGDDSELDAIDIADYAVQLLDGAGLLKSRDK